MFAERGGSSTLARHAFNELISFIAGWAILIDYIIVIALAAVSFSQYLSPIWGGFTHGAGEIVAVGVAIGGAAAVNAAGWDEVVRHKLMRLPDSEAARRGLLGEAARPGRGRVGEGDLDMASDNNVTVVGNVTRDPELRFTPERAGGRHLRPRRQPPLAEPPDPGVGGEGLLLRRHLLGPDGRERGRVGPEGHPRAS